MSGFQRFAGGTLMSLTLLYSEVFHLILESVHSYNQWHVNQTWQWKVKSFFYVEMFYLNTTLYFGIPPVLIFQLEVYYKLDRLLTGLSAKKEQLLDCIQIKHLYFEISLYIRIPSFATKSIFQTGNPPIISEIVLRVWNYL